jgi:hypothetical protein
MNVKGNGMAQWLQTQSTGSDWKTKTKISGLENQGRIAVKKKKGEDKCSQEFQYVVLCPTRCQYFLFASTSTRGDATKLELSH